MHFIFQLYQIFNKYFPISKDFWKNLIKEFIHNNPKIKKSCTNTKNLYTSVKFYTKIFILKIIICFGYFFKLTKKKTNERRFDDDDQKKPHTYPRIPVQNFVHSIWWRRQREAYILKFAYWSARRCPNVVVC